MRKIRKLKFVKVFDLQNSSRTSFYKKILFPNSNFNIWSSSETTLPKDKTKEEIVKKDKSEYISNRWGRICWWLSNRFIITKNVEGVDGFTEDVVSFMQYVYAVKTDWDPQFSSIVKNKETIFPEICYKNKADSLKLESVIYLAKTCGSGFSRKEGYWAQKIMARQC